MRKFVYLVVALLPFVAFILLLPRGGEEGPAAPSATPSPTPPQAIQLAFPYDLSPREPEAEPEVVQMEESSEPRQCSDGIDNDRDRRTDYPADPGCTSRNDNSEAAPVRTSPRPPAPPPPPPPPPPSPPQPPPPPPTVPPSPPPADESDDGDQSDDSDSVGNLPTGGPSCEPGDPGFPNCP